MTKKLKKKRQALCKNPTTRQLSQESQLGEGRQVTQDLSNGIIDSADLSAGSEAIKDKSNTIGISETAEKAF